MRSWGPLPEYRKPDMRRSHTYIARIAQYCGQLADNDEVRRACYGEPMMREKVPSWLVVSCVWAALGHVSIGCSDDGDGTVPAVDAGVNLDAPEAPAAMVPELYSTDRTLSPITPYVAANLRAIAESRGDLRDDVFAKIGGGNSVSSNFMHCFDDGHVDAAPGEEPGAIDVDGRVQLKSAIAHFRDGDAAGSNPYQRFSRAAAVGVHIADVGSLLADEVADISPRFAAIALGEADLPDEDMDSFGTDLLDLADLTISSGVIPIFMAMGPRADDPDLAAEVAHFNAIIRGVAQAHQVPFIDLYRELATAPDQGLGEDGVLPSVYRLDGTPAACVFTAEGLRHGYNLRNLRTLETLARAFAAAIADDPAPDQPAGTLLGSGSADDPWVIDELPFAHLADTSMEGARAVDTYPGCQANQDESGPELTYRLELTATTRVRAAVIDRGTADIDVHILDGSPDGDACIERAHKLISAELAPGTYFINLDTFVGQDGEQSGEYLFTLTEEPL